MTKAILAQLGDGPGRRRRRRRRDDENVPNNMPGLGAAATSRARSTPGRASSATSRTTSAPRAARAPVPSGWTNPSKPVRVTLAWTDPPGPTIGNSFVNNLNLGVEHRRRDLQGERLRGRRVGPGGNADPRNNLESVYLPAGHRRHIHRSRSPAANIARRRSAGHRGRERPGLRAAWSPTPSRCIRAGLRPEGDDDRAGGRRRRRGGRAGRGLQRLPGAQEHRHRRRHRHPGRAGRVGPGHDHGRLGGVAGPGPGAVRAQLGRPCGPARSGRHLRRAALADTGDHQH